MSLKEGPSEPVGILSGLSDASLRSRYRYYEREIKALNAQADDYLQRCTSSTEHAQMQSPRKVITEESEGFLASSLSGRRPATCTHSFDMSTRRNADVKGVHASPLATLQSTIDVHLPTSQAPPQARSSPLLRYHENARWGASPRRHQVEEQSSELSPARTRRIQKAHVSTTRSQTTHSSIVGHTRCEGGPCCGREAGHWREPPVTDKGLLPSYEKQFLRRLVDWERQSTRAQGRGSRSVSPAERLCASSLSGAVTPIRDLTPASRRRSRAPAQAHLASLSSPEPVLSKLRGLRLRFQESESPRDPRGHTHGSREWVNENEGMKEHPYDEDSTSAEMLIDEVSAPMRRTACVARASPSTISYDGLSTIQPHSLKDSEVLLNRQWESVQEARESFMSLMATARSGR